MIIRARRAFRHDEAPPAPRDDDNDETLSLTVSGARGLGAVLRAWRTQGRGSGTFPLEETAHVTYAADLGGPRFRCERRTAGDHDVAVVLFFWSGRGERRIRFDRVVTSPCMRYRWRGVAGLCYTIGRRPRGRGVRGRRRAPRRAHRFGASFTAPIDGWVRISGDGNYRGALRVRAATRRSRSRRRASSPSRRRYHRSRQRRRPPRRPWPTPPLP